MASLWGHWRDNAGNQTPTTSWAGFNMASQIRNDSGSNLTKPNDSTVQVGEALPSGKAKIFIANIKWDTSHNNRGNIQARFVLSSGTGNLFTTYATGFVRNTSNNETWVRVIGVLTGNSLNAQVQLQWRRSSQGITTATLANVSDLQVADLYYSEIGMYTDSVGNQALGGTTRTTVNLDTNVQQTNTAAIERVGDQVTMKGDNKKYLILGSVAGDTGGSRTQRNICLAYDGTADLATQGYCYQRNSANPYGGVVLHDLYETSTANVTVEMQGYRGDGVAANQGGADVDGSWNTTPGFSGLCVIELEDDAEGFHSTDGTGGQDIAGGATSTINAIRTTDFNDSASYTRASNTVMNVETDHNMLAFSSLWAARVSVAGNARGNIGARITINGTDQSVGEHGNYSRGNQGSQDCFGWGANPGGIFAVTNTDDIGVETFDSGDNGGDDTTQAGSVMFWALNLDTLEPAASGVTGTANITEGADTVSSSGDVAIDGSSDVTEGSDTSDSDGTVDIVGAASITEGADSVTANGTISIDGSGSITEDPDTLDATGTLMDVILGTANITEGADTVSSSGDVTIIGTSDIDENDDIITSNGDIIVDGTASITENPDTLTATGVVGSSVITGTANITEDADTVDAEGTARTIVQRRPRFTGGGGKAPIEPIEYEPSRDFLLDKVANDQRKQEEDLLLLLII